METLKKRIDLMEQKISPKRGFDLIKHIQDIHIEAERLMQLPESQYKMETEQPPKTTVEKVARIGVSDKKRFANLTPEQQRRELGYPNLDAIEFAEIQKDRALKLSSPDWVTRLFAERQRNTLPRNHKDKED